MIIHALDPRQARYRFFGHRFVGFFGNRAGPGEFRAFSAVFRQRPGEKICRPGYSITAAGMVPYRDLVPGVKTASGTGNCDGICRNRAGKGSIRGKRSPVRARIIVSQWGYPELVHRDRSVITLFRHDPTCSQDRSRTVFLCSCSPFRSLCTGTGKTGSRPSRYSSGLPGNTCDFTGRLSDLRLFEIFPGAVMRFHTEYAGNLRENHWRINALGGSAHASATDIVATSSSP